ncbi:MAG: serine/threonine protein kinase [Paludibacteraceae bacterium]
MIESEFTAQTPIQDTQNEVLINSGGTADCYKISLRNRFYIVKRPKNIYADNAEYLQLFHKEFDLGIQLDHPNIVRYYDLGKDDKGLFIRMDYVDGENLTTFVQQNPDYFRKRSHRQQFIDELLGAIAYMHAHEMLHLDIKPQNILITRHGQHVKLIDLGFAWTQAYRSHNGCSKDFCAPEQLDTTAGSISPATDIYAIGKVFDLFGLAPKSIVARCTKETTQQRFQNIEALQKALRRHAALPRRIATTAACLILLAATPALYMLQPRPEPITTVTTITDTIVIRDTIVAMPPPKVLTKQDKFRAAIRHVFDSIYAPFYRQYPTYTEEMKYAIEEPFDAANAYADEKLSSMNLSFQDEIEYTQIVSEEINRIMSPFNRMANAYEP